jgi:hypothetical protein
MTVYFSGYVFQDDGDALSGATVELVQVSDGVTEVSTTTDSNGLWAFNEADDDRYDVKITKGSSVRYRKWADEISLKTLDVRNNEGNTVGAASFTNLTNNASNQVATFSGANSTRADGDEIYLSFKLANSAGDIEEFARITAEAVDVTDGAEDGQLRFGVAKTDGTITDVFTINSTTGGETSMTLDVSGDLTLDADGGDVFFKDGGTTFGSATNNSGNLIIKSGTTTAATFTGANVLFAGTVDATTDFTVGTTVITDDVITFTPTASDTVTMTAATNGAFSLVTVDAAAAAANIQITADGTVDIDSAGVLTLDSGAAINIEPASGSAVLIDGTVSIDGGAITGVASILEADVKIGEDDQTKIDFETADEIHFYAGNENQLTLTDGALTPSSNAIVDLGTDALEFKDAYFDGTLEADAITIGGTNIVSGSLITTLGTISAGTWQGTAIASAYLDSDTAHLTTTQTFSGAKTFSTGVAINVANEDLALLTLEADMGTNNNRTLIISTPATDSASEPFRINTGNSLSFEIDGTERIELDSSGNTNFVGALTVGVDDTGHDVKFFGATSGKYMMWDESADTLQVEGKFTAIGGSEVSNVLVDTHADFLFNDGEARIQIAADDNGSNAASIILTNVVGLNDNNNWVIAHKGPSASNDFRIGYRESTSAEDVVANASDRLAITTAGAVTFYGAVDLQANTLTTTGSIQGRTIDYSDGDLAMTIADGGGVTFAQNVTMDANLDMEGYSVFGDGSGLDPSYTLTIDRAFSDTSQAVSLRVRGTITSTDGTGTLAGFQVQPAGTVINSGNAHNVYSAWFIEPAITETSGSVTTAATVYIQNAPDEGTNNYALFVDSGVTRLDGAITTYGDINVRGTTPDLILGDGGAEDTSIHFGGGTSNTVNGATTDTDWVIARDNTYYAFTLNTGDSINHLGTAQRFSFYHSGSNYAAARLMGAHTQQNDQQILYGLGIGYDLVATERTTDSTIYWYSHCVIGSGSGGTIVTSLYVDDPGITDSGDTITRGSTLYVENAPSQGETANYALWVDSGKARLDDGVIIGPSDSTNNLIDNATNGSGASTLYIGNTSITTSSDARLKTDIKSTSIDALNLIDELNVVDFGWDDPTDTIKYGKNYRGKYVGMLAQETVKVAPWIINDQGGGRDCTNCMAGLECDVHGMFQVEYQHLVPTLVKAIQELRQELQEVKDDR